MSRATLFAVAALLSSLVSCSPVQSESPYAVKETHMPPMGWKRLGPPLQNHTLVLQIGLKQGRFDELERHLYQVSDPAHRRYGKHLTAEQVQELIRPSEVAVDLVNKWLLDYGIDTNDLSYTPAKDWISVNIDLQRAERLLNTTYSVFQHKDGTQLIRTPQWSLPIHLHEHIVAIQPTNSFMKPFSQFEHHKKIMDRDRASYETTAQVLAAPNPSNTTLAKLCKATSVTPACLRALYRTNDYKPRAAGRNRIGITNYLGNTSNRTDINLFIDQYVPWAKGVNFPITSIAGGKDNQSQISPEEYAKGRHLEGNLDAGLVIAMGYPTPLEVWNTGSQPPFIPDSQVLTNTNEPFMAWLNHILSQRTIPQTISTSYGDHEQTVPPSYARAVCNQFAQLGARGVTMLFSSGDSGVGGTPYNAQWCVSNDGSSRPQFTPIFPASCPYVTTVGATKEFEPEVLAWNTYNSFAPGAGYSQYFPRPKYQDGVVPSYTRSLGKQFRGLYNPEGRVYPDISALGQRIVTVWYGMTLMIDGTSASAPIAAGIISLINDALIAEGRPPLGFINPWLYKDGWRAFNDITSGSARGCNSSGFPAQKGWDAASGWGSPDFIKLKDAAFRASFFPWWRKRWW